MDEKQNPNLKIVKLAARQLGELKDEMVFLGGSATGLLITDPAARAVRVTRDVDVIVQVMNRSDYYQLSDRLRQRGFQEDISEDAPICRWRTDVVILDVIPTNTEILGFGNQWYISAMDHAETVQLGADLEIRHVSAPYFLITKLEAFAGRGNGDFMLSQDIEDIIAVIDGRKEILEEVDNCELELKETLSDCIDDMLSDGRFTDAIPGHLLPDEASQARVPIVIERLKQIAGS